MIAPLDILQYCHPKTDSIDEYVASIKTNLNTIFDAIHSRRQKKRLQNERTQNASRRSYKFEKDDIVNIRQQVISAQSGLKVKYSGPFCIDEISKEGQTVALSSLLEGKISKSHIQNLDMSNIFQLTLFCLTIGIRI